MARMIAGRFRWTLDKVASQDLYRPQLRLGSVTVPFTTAYLI
jgi:hypothetical protein